MTHKKYRYEHFGGIVGIDDPPALVFVDRKYMKHNGFSDSPLWHSGQRYLSAPTEVHFSITGKCPLHCQHCTADSGESLEQEMTTAEIKEAIDILAEMKVFHIAFGGGELFARPDVIELAEYARAKDIVPNATTNGYYITPELARECKVFGQINVSLDGVNDDYAIVRKSGDFATADRALKALTAAGVTAGINCMVTKVNFDKLETVVNYAQELGLREVLFLRLKPSGRALQIYEDYKLTHEQNKRFFPFLMAMSAKYQPVIQVDCSFVPHICYHKPSKKAMQVLGVEGCEGGNILLGVRPDGWINACSHYREYFQNLFDLPKLWNEHSHFKQFRERQVQDSACRSCGYFKICHGGCPLFSEVIGGDFNMPDPECPVLIERKGVKGRGIFTGWQRGNEK